MYPHNKVFQEKAHDCNHIGEMKSHKKRLLSQNIHTEFKIYQSVFDRIQIKVNYNQLNIKKVF